MFKETLGGRAPAKEEVLAKAVEIDQRFGQHFKNYGIMNKDAVAQLLHQVRTLNNEPVQIVPVIDDQMHTFEVAHRIEMPEELKAWLRFCNGAAVNPGGLYSLLSDQPSRVSMDWYLRSYPAWRKKNWFPIAGDGSGDVYVLMGNITLPSTGTHPISFLDQSDFSEPEYLVASGLWRFLYFLLQNQILSDAGKGSYWPFNEKAVLAVDPDLVQCKEVPLPWEALRKPPRKKAISDQ